MLFSTLVQLYFGDQFYCKRLKMTISYQYKMYYLIVTVKYHNDMVCPCLYHHSQYQIPPVYTTTHSTRSLLFIPTLIVPDPSCYTTTHCTRSLLFIPPLTVPDPTCLYHHSQYQIPPVYTTTHSTRSLLFIPTLIVPDPTCLYQHS
jgi:hypothetical protein